MGSRIKMESGTLKNFTRLNLDELVIKLLEMSFAFILTSKELLLFYRGGIPEIGLNDLRMVLDMIR